MSREVPFDSFVECATEINGVLGRKHDLADKLAVRRVRSHIRKLNDNRVVRDGNLRGITERRFCVLRYGYRDFLFLIHGAYEKLARNGTHKIIYPYHDSIPAFFHKFPSELKIGLGSRVFDKALERDAEKG